MVLLFELGLILFLSLFSQPWQEMGLNLSQIFNLQASGKVARVIFVYHSIAVPFAVALLYLYFFIFRLEKREIAAVATPGYILTALGGIGFAYVCKNWILHGIFIFGLSLVFFSGLLFLKELFQNLTKNFSLETFSYFLTTLFILISVVIGAMVASYFGQGFKAFLAEDVLRASHNLFQRTIIAHLHLMLALIDVFLLLLVISAYKVEEKLKKTLLILVPIGILVVSGGTWSVIFWEKMAHKIINFGSIFLLLPALILGVKGLKDKWKDAPWLGIFFYLLAVNFFVTLPGIYVAINLERFRSLPYQIERTFAVGHWHVLATITAVVAFLLLGALSLEGRTRQILSYLATFGSALAFIGAFYYQFFGKSYLSMRLIDAGILGFLVAVFLYLGLRVKNFSRRG